MVCDSTHVVWCVLPYVWCGVWFHAWCVIPWMVWCVIPYVRCDMWFHTCGVAFHSIHVVWCVISYMGCGMWFHVWCGVWFHACGVVCDFMCGVRFHICGVVCDSMCGVVSDSIHVLWHVIPYMWCGMWFHTYGVVHDSICSMWCAIPNIWCGVWFHTYGVVRDSICVVWWQCSSSTGESKHPAHRKYECSMGQSRNFAIIQWCSTKILHCCCCRTAQKESGSRIFYVPNNFGHCCCFQAAATCHWCGLVALQHSKQQAVRQGYLSTVSREMERPHRCNLSTVSRNMFSAPQVLPVTRQVFLIAGFHLPQGAKSGNRTNHWSTVLLGINLLAIT